MGIVRKDTPPFPCGVCGKMISPQPRRYGTGPQVWVMPTKFCSHACSGVARAEIHRGKRRASRGTGKGWVDTLGYKRFSDPERRGTVHEHRLVMEKILGRKLKKGETIHHKDGNRINNSPDNLELWASGHPSGQRLTEVDIWSGMIPPYQHGAL